MGVAAPAGMRSSTLLLACAVASVAACDDDTSPPTGGGATGGGGSDGARLLDPTTVPKYGERLVIPPVMPRLRELPVTSGEAIDYYEIALRQLTQQILPAGMPATTVWGYGSVASTATFNYPSFTIEAKWRRPVRVKWLNELVRDPVDCFYTPGGPTQAGSCNYLPHLLPIDQTLHWANPVGDCADSTRKSDCRGTSPTPYVGPVPMVVHVHGAQVREWSDGYPEAWFLPNANDIPPDYRTEGALHGVFQSRAESAFVENPIEWGPGHVVFEYPNEQQAATLWYHDHALGMTRVNVYAGTAGFYLLRGGPGDEVAGRLPSPAPGTADAPGTAYYEIPLAIQDRSFREDGSLFYPSDRASFEGVAPDDLRVPLIPSNALSGQPSDIPPIWNPEFFGNTIVVNGKTWPYLEAEPRRYRLRLLNGGQARTLVLRLVTATDPANVATWSQVQGAFWQIGAERGFLPSPIQLDQLVMAPAERADVIVDFGAIGVPSGAGLYLVNVGPDEPFRGGTPGVDFRSADPATTGQVMEFRMVEMKGADESTNPSDLGLPAPASIPEPTTIRRLSLDEMGSSTVFVDEEMVEVPAGTAGAVPFGPTQARLGNLDAYGDPEPLMWSEKITEEVEEGATEQWEIYNFTMDSHPIHLHVVQFQVLGRQSLALGDDRMPVRPAMLVPGSSRPPEAWETGPKDTVIAYPGEVIRLQARFPYKGLFVWHCHILEHEDNEMMRPYCVGHATSCMEHDGNAGL